MESPLLKVCEKILDKCLSETKVYSAYEERDGLAHLPRCLFFVVVL